jgi:hypothetical protein
LLEEAKNSCSTKVPANAPTVDSLSPLIRVKSNVVEAPFEVKFAVPKTASPSSDAPHDQIRYVNVNKMPPEMQQVIEAYIEALFGRPHALKDLQGLACELALSAAKAEAKAELAREELGLG